MPPLNNTRPTGRKAQLLKRDKLAWRRLLEGRPEDKPEARIDLAKRGDVIPSVLMSLSGDTDYCVRMAVASNKRTPTSALGRLSKDVMWSVREAVAYNPSTPAAQLSKLANDEDESVRSAVAQNRRSPKRVLSSLAQDSVISIRVAVSENTNATAKVRLRAKQTAATPRKACSEPEERCGVKAKIFRLRNEIDRAIDVRTNKLGGAACIARLEGILQQICLSGESS